MSKFNDLTGQRFGKLIVVSRATNYIKPNGNKIIQWRCVCDCSNEVVVRGEYLKSEHTKSCGCNKSISHTITHGKSKSRLYKIWVGMKERCYNPNRNSYCWYGAKGICVCDEWDDFENFYDWSMNHGYSDELTIDRIDSNGNYCPENCRWSTDREQANNRSTNRIIEYNGESHTLEEWSKITGIASSTIRMRLDEYKWDVKKSITKSTTPAKKAE